MQNNKFRKNLRAVREQLRMSQSECAHQLNINITTYRNYENTDREPDYDTLIKISNLLKVSIDDLLGNAALTTKMAPLRDEALTPDQQELFRLYTGLSSLNKGRALERIRILSESEIHERNKENKISG